MHFPENDAGERQHAVSGFPVSRPYITSVTRTVRATHLFPTQRVYPMKAFLGLMFTVSLLAGLAGSARGEDTKATDVLDKAIKAIGGQEKLDKIKGITWKAKGTITINGDDSEFTSQATAQGIEH